MPTPVVTVEKIADAREGGADGVFRFTRTGATTDPLTVAVRVTGTATTGDDYAADFSAYYVVIPAGESTIDGTIGAAADGVYDPDETVVVTIQTAVTYPSGSGSYTIGTAGAATVTIEDNASGVFELGSNEGVIWYDVAWEDVDPDAATDTASLTNFTLVFAGQTFTPSTASFTVSPTAEFEYGDLVNIKFTVEFASPVAGFEKLIVDNGLVTGVDAITHLPGTPVALADKTIASLTLDFSTITIPTGTNFYEMKITVELENKTLEAVTMEVRAGATPGSIRDSFQSALEGLGLKPLPSGTNSIVVRGLANDGLKKLTLAVPGPWTEPTLIGRARPSPNRDYPDYVKE